MYSLGQVRRGLRRTLSNPAYLGRELNRLYHRRGYREAFNRDGVDVMTEDWDTLLILDACRYDDFEATHDLPGELHRRESRGSHTIEFLHGTVAGRDLLDTVYVTASPQLHAKGIDAAFHAVENVWDGDDWDETAGTVRPETMADRVLAAVKRYSHKRVVGHFVQPHYPFLGEDDPQGGQLTDASGPDIWGRLMRGEAEATPGAVRAAYRRNLETVLPAVGRLLETLAGRTVVTADHGNMFGERSWPLPVREWGHPPGVHTPELVDVPWLVHEDGRRETHPDPPIEPDAADEDAVRRRLERLGYQS